LWWKRPNDFLSEPAIPRSLIISSLLYRIHFDLQIKKEGDSEENYIRSHCEKESREFLPWLSHWG
jgi:hypothetical protein